MIDCGSRRRRASGLCRWCAAWIPRVSAWNEERRREIGANDVEAPDRVQVKG